MKLILIIFLFYGNLTMLAAQGDTNQIAKINYPVLTEREGKGLTIPLPPNEHPRLFLRQKDISILKKKIDSPLLKACWSRIQKASTYTTDGFLPLNAAKNNNNEEVKNTIEAKALLYLFSEEKKIGREAIDIALHYFATLKIDNAAQDITREIGRAIVTGSIVYDWCYQLLTEKEKYILIGRMETLATKMEIEWPNIKGSSITSHTVEAQLSRDMLSLGIATYNENPEIYNRVVGRIFSEFIPVRQFYYPAGYHHQGSAYGAYRFNWEMVTTFIFDRMGYPNIYGKTQKNIPYYFIYNHRPDGQLIRDGDDYTEQSTPFGKWWILGQGVDLLAGSYHKDPIVLNEALKERPLGETSDYLFDFLFFDPEIVENKTKESLPLTTYFKEPYGTMTARTSWEDGIKSNAVVTQMKIGTYNFANHQHLDAGSFQLYYKGPLTVQSGIYQGKNGTYGGEHFKNYSQRSIAHNTLLVYDPNEQFTWHGKKVINDGGQKYPNNAHEPVNMNELLNQGYKTGEVLAHAFGPDTIKPEFSYLKGEIVQAYSDKVKSVKRSFVFLNLDTPTQPAALIVFDKVVATDKNFKKYWLLHGVEEPQIDGIHTTFSRTQKGYHGKLTNTTLIPDKKNLSINKIGGENKEYEVFGQNYPQSMVNLDGSSGDSAVWRIEVSPKIATTQDSFLNVMQVMDVDTPPILPKKSKTTQFVGTQIRDRIVLFSKTGELIHDTFKISVKGTFKVLITDVQQGNWVLKAISKKMKPLSLKNDAQLLYFTVKEGDYIISKE